MKRKLSIAKVLGMILAVVQLVLSGILAMQFWDMGFLPTKLWVAIAGVLIVLFFIVFVNVYKCFPRRFSGMVNRNEKAPCILYLSGMIL